MTQEREESEEHEGEPEQSEAKPSKADCNKAIKLLTEYERLYKKAGGRPTTQQIERGNALREAETITSNDLSGSIQREFPGSLKGLTLGEIRKLCGKQR